MQRNYAGDYWRPIAAVAIPLLLYQWLQAHPDINRPLVYPRGHFYVVSAVSVLSAALSAAIGIAGMRLRNTQVLFLSVAFFSLSAIFAVHGLSTPGFLLGSTHLPPVAAQLSVTATVLWLGLSCVSSGRRATVFLTKHAGGVMIVWLLAVTAVSVASLLFPHAIDRIPVDRHPLKGGLAALSFALNAVALRKYWSTYRYTRFPLQMAIVYAVGWLALAQWIMVTSETFRASWWIYHFLLLAAALAVLRGLYLQYASGSGPVSAVRSLFETDPAARLEAALTPSVRALIAATEKKDAYTAGHNYRVALYALMIGKRLGLSPIQMRAMAQGGILHDVGKLEVPDAILNKPGKLTEEERRVVEGHPAAGYDMCRRLGFMKEELEIIRSHHEKWDGTGYPDRLSGERIPKLARILAVADIYDALTSERAYRPAMAHEEAMRVLDGMSGIHLDPACLQAWRHICGEGAPRLRSVDAAGLQVV